VRLNNTYSLVAAEPHGIAAMCARNCP